MTLEEDCFKGFEEFVCCTHYHDIAVASPIYRPINIRVTLNLLKACGVGHIVCIVAVEFMCSIVQYCLHYAAFLHSCIYSKP